MPHDKFVIPSFTSNGPPPRPSPIHTTGTCSLRVRKFQKYVPGECNSRDYEIDATLYDGVKESLSGKGIGPCTLMGTGHDDEAHESAYHTAGAIDQELLTLYFNGEGFEENIFNEKNPP